jgi:hypothetical protein
MSITDHLYLAFIVASVVVAIVLWRRGRKSL